MSGEESMKAVFAFCLMVCGAVSGWCQGQAAKGGGAVFEIAISVNGDSLKTEMYKKWGEFFVDTKIKNISDADQEIVVWTQQGWSWVSDNPDVAPGTEAAKNIPAKIELKPGEEYAGAVELFCDPNKNKPLTFRLGFTPKAETPVSDEAGFASAQNKVILWSNAVALTE
jgi:hypothetical protein